MFTKEFGIDLLERAIKTFAQTLVSVFIVSGTTVLNADWPTALAAAGTAALVSVLTSLASALKSNDNDNGEPLTASLIGAVEYRRVP